jgi:hypothetical protein
MVRRTIVIFYMLVWLSGFVIGYCIGRFELWRIRRIK